MNIMRKLLSVLTLSAVISFNILSSNVINATTITSEDMLTIAEVKNDNDWHYREGRINYYYRFYRSDDLTKMAADVYSYSDRPVWVRITSDDNYNSEKMSELLGEEIDPQFSFAIGVDIDTNQHVYKYSDDFDYDSVYKMSGVKKLEFVRFTYVTQIYKCNEQENVFDEIGEDRDHTDIIAVQIAVPSEVELNEELFSELDTEIVKIEKSDAVNKQGFRYWTVFYRFRGDYNIYSDIDAISKKIDKNAVTRPYCYTKLCIASENAEYFDYKAEFAEASNGDVSVIEPFMLLGDINSDGTIDLTDLSELSLTLVGDKVLSEDQLKAADINKNGEADLSDLARLKQYLSKVITSLS